MKSLNDPTTTTSSTDTSILPSWFKKSVLLVGTIGAMRRCKHTIFYELNNCHIPSEEFEQIFQLTSSRSTVINNNNEEELNKSNDTFPSLLKSADRIWTYVEYQR